MVRRPGGSSWVVWSGRQVGANGRIYGGLTALEPPPHTFTGRHGLPSLPELCRRLDAALSDLAGALGHDRPPAPLPALDVALAGVRDHLAAAELARARERGAGTAGPGGRPEDTAGPGGRPEDTAGPGG